MPGADGKETERIEAFSDAVFAIAITLLVLDLHVPEKDSGGSAASLKKLLADQWPSFLAFTLSFFSIFVMWVNHHRIFKQIYKRNSPVVFANGLILFFATCISYPAALLARYSGSEAFPVAAAVYTGLFVLINLSYNLLWMLASRDKGLLRPGMSDRAIQLIKKNYLYGVPVHLFAFVVSFFMPGLALVVCALLWMYWGFTSGKVDYLH